MVVYSIRNDNTDLEYKLRLDFNGLEEMDDWLYKNGSQFYKIQEKYNSIDGGCYHNITWEYYDVLDNQLTDLINELMGYFNKYNKLI